MSSAMNGGGAPASPSNPTAIPGTPLTPAQLSTMSAGLATKGFQTGGSDAAPSETWDSFNKAMNPQKPVDTEAAVGPHMDWGNVWEGIKQDASGYGKQVLGHITDSWQQIVNGEAPGKSVGDMIVGMGKSANDLLSAGGDVIKGTAAAAMEPMKEASRVASNTKSEQGLATNPMLKPVLDTYDTVTKMGSDKWAALKQSHPEVAQLLDNILTYGSVAAAPEAGEVAGEAGAAAREGVTSAVETAGKTVGDHVIQPTVDATTAAIKAPFTKVADALSNHEIARVKDEWEAPTKASGFSASKDIYAHAESQGHDISETLTNDRLNPAEHVEGEGSASRFDTQEAADNIRKDAATMSNQMLRPALKAADAAITKTPVNDILREARANIDNNPKITLEDKESMKGTINNSVRPALEKAHPDGMGLADAHDEKITRDLNSKYSPTGDIATNMKATTNKAVADALRSTIERNAPKDIDVKAFNHELQRQFQAADYLESLDGKKVPITTMAKLRKWAGKIVGLGIISHFGGSEILKDIIGYNVGGLLETMAERLPNPVRSMYLRNLEVENPKAFAAVSDYLKKTGQENETRMKLPPAADLSPGTSKNPFIMGGSTTFEKPADIINRINSSPSKNIFDMMDQSQKEEFINQIKNGQLKLTSGASAPTYIGENPLPAGRGSFKPTNVVNNQLPAPKGESSAIAAPAKAISIQDPVTGKFSKAFTSDVKGKMGEDAATFQKATGNIKKTPGRPTKIRVNPGTAKEAT